MRLDIREEALALAAQSEHAAIPIAFVVDRVLEVRLLGGGLGGMSLPEAAVTDPYVKDYDAVEGAGPLRWPGRLDVSHWGLISARWDGAGAGGGVIASKPPGLHMLGDSAVRLHALASLIAQAQQLLPQAVHDARDRELTWAQIGELLNTTAGTAARRYQNRPRST
jgi:hypothetical protein